MFPPVFFIIQMILASSTLGTKNVLGYFFHCVKSLLSINELIDFLAAQTWLPLTVHAAVDFLYLLHLSVFWIDRLHVSDSIILFSTFLKAHSPLRLSFIGCPFVCFQVPEWFIKTIPCSSASFLQERLPKLVVFRFLLFVTIVAFFLIRFIFWLLRKTLHYWTNLNAALHYISSFEFLLVKIFHGILHVFALITCQIQLAWKWLFYRFNPDIVFCLILKLPFLLHWV